MRSAIVSPIPPNCDTAGGALNRRDNEIREVTFFSRMVFIIECMFGCVDALVSYLGFDSWFPMLISKLDKSDNL